MRIFFDGQGFNSRAYGGGGRYFLELILRLTALPACEVAMFAGAYRTPLPLEALNGLCRPFLGLRAPRLGPLGTKFEQAVNLLGRWYLSRTGADIYHPTSYDPFPSGRAIPRVYTVFDVIHERYPQYRFDSTADRRKRALDEAAAVVCISEATLRQTLEFYPSIAGKASVIPLASSLRLPDDLSPHAASGRPYFLFVGNRGGYKNFRVMFEACRAIPRFAENYALVCFGGGKFSDEERHMIAESGLSGCIEQLAGDDILLASLYRDAICFVYPSLEEGFGIPLLEAMNCGCAVLASRIPVFEEVGDDAIGYFDPNAPEELAQRMREMADDAERKQALVRVGTRRATLFSWERCAQQHFDLYARVANR